MSKLNPVSALVLFAISLCSLMVGMWVVFDLTLPFNYFERIGAVLCLTFGTLGVRESWGGLMSILSEVESVGHSDPSDFGRRMGHLWPDMPQAVLDHLKGETSEVSKEEAVRASLYSARAVAEYGLHGSSSPFDALKYAPVSTYLKRDESGELRRLTPEEANDAVRKMVSEMILGWEPPQVVIDYLNGDASKQAEALHLTLRAAQQAASDKVLEKVRDEARKATGNPNDNPIKNPYY